MNFLGRKAGYSEKELEGIFVSGGSMANLTAAVIARDDKLAEADFHLGTVYVSDQTHSSVAKGLRIIGIQTKNIRKVKTDSQFQMKIDHLTQLIKEDKTEGKTPFLVVATAGTTNTRSVDPLKEIAQVAKENNLWLHVDGAFGASALLSSYARELAGIELSDSISWDGHKWLFQTYGCAALIVKDRQKMAQSFSENPEYLLDVASGDEAINFWDIGIELTRPLRGIRLWYTVQVMGLDKIKEAIDVGYKNAVYIQQRFEEMSNFEIISPAQMSVVNVRYNDESNEVKLNQINHQLSQMATEQNEAIYYTTQLNGHIVLRFCAIQPELTKEEIDQLLTSLEENVKKIKK